MAKLWATYHHHVGRDAPDIIGTNYTTVHLESTLKQISDTAAHHKDEFRAQSQRGNQRGPTQNELRGYPVFINTDLNLYVLSLFELL